MNLGFVIDNRKCIGCHACTVACKAEHSVALGVNRTWVKYIEKGVFPFSRRYFSVHRCNHCENAPCVTICPVGALFTRDNGIVDFDKERCIGCRSCMQACPYDSLYIDPETKTSAKCNYCAHRVEKGIEPSCVVVCPEQAITSGDLDDPESGISRLVSHERVMVRKPEKDTRPKLFYIEAEQTMLRPSAAPPHVIYTQAEQASGVGHYAKNSGRRGLKPRVSGLLPCEPDRPDPAPKAIQARRVYDAPARGVLWGWELPAYLWSKSIGAGLVFITLALQLLGLGELTLRQEWHIAGAGLAMMVLTALFLVKDLDRPGRFIYVLLRPQWKSWLTRGGYIISVFCGLLTLWGGLAWLGFQLPALLKALLVVGGVMTTVYTAFLFAQAKGRDFWQSPLMSVHMLAQGAMAGSAAWLGLAWYLDGALPGTTVILLQVAIVAHLLVMLVEFTLPHSSRDVELVTEMILHGPFQKSFAAAVILGNLLPLGLLSAPVDELRLAAAVLVLLFALVVEHIWVRAPQLVSLR